MIAEGAVVGVLHDAHHLNGVIAGGFDAREHLRGKLRPCADPGFLQGHAGVGFIDAGKRCGCGGGVLPLIGVCRRHEGEKFQRLRVLGHAAPPSRQALAAAAGPLHADTIALTLPERMGRKTQFPFAGL